MYMMGDQRGPQQVGVTISSLANGKTMYVWNATVPSVKSMAGTLTNNDSIQTIEIDNIGNPSGLIITDNASGWSMPIQPGQRLICNCPPSNNPAYSLSGNSANVTIYLYDFIFSQPGIISTGYNNQTNLWLATYTETLSFNPVGVSLTKMYAGPIPSGTSNWYVSGFSLTTSALNAPTTAFTMPLNLQVIDSPLGNSFFLYQGNIYVPINSSVSFSPIIISEMSFSVPLLVGNNQEFDLNTGGGTWGGYINCQVFLIAI